MTNSVLFIFSIVFYLFAVVLAYKIFGKTGLYFLLVFIFLR